MRKIIVGISGATGVEIGYRVLQALGETPDVETHLIVSDGAKLIRAVCYVDFSIPTLRRVVSSMQSRADVKFHEHVTHESYKD